MDKWETLHQKQGVRGGARPPGVHHLPVQLLLAPFGTHQLLLTPGLMKSLESHPTFGPSMDMAHFANVLPL